MIKIKISKCINSCPFYFNSMDGMECTHPSMLELGAYNNMIITHGIDIPEKCPLRKEDLIVKYELLERGII